MSNVGGKIVIVRGACCYKLIQYLFCKEVWLVVFMVHMLWHEISEALAMWLVNPTEEATSVFCSRYVEQPQHLPLLIQEWLKVVVKLKDKSISSGIKVWKFARHSMSSYKLEAKKEILSLYLGISAKNIRIHLFYKDSFVSLIEESKVKVNSQV